MRISMLFLLILACSPRNRLNDSISESSAQSQLSGDTTPKRNFQNPILQNGADPWVIFKDGMYYHCYSNGNDSIFVRRSTSLEKLESAESVLIWKSTPGKPYSSGTWAPELHFIEGKWYVYFAADDGNNASHRMFVLEAKSKDPQGAYDLKGSIKSNNWAIDGTVLPMKDGKLYFVWSGWAGRKDIQQNLMIAPMANPWTLADQNIFRQKIEAENAKLQNVKVRNYSEASAGRVASKIDHEDSSLTFTVNVPSKAAYALDLRYANGSNVAASYRISTNNSPARSLRLPNSGWENIQVATTKVELEAGSNTIRISKGDAYAELDAIEVKTYGIDPVAISFPENDWERRAGPSFVNEGPQVLQRNGRTMVVYSASGSWSDYYCLGQLSLVGNDPMDPNAWRKDGVVFQSANEVYGPGHASFTTSPDGKEDWIVYHAAKRKGSGWDRNVRIQPFKWKADNSPDFGQPLPLDRTLSIQAR